MIKGDYLRALPRNKMSRRDIDLMDGFLAKGFSVDVRIALANFFLFAHDFKVPFEIIAEMLNEEWVKSWRYQRILVRANPDVVGPIGEKNRKSLHRIHEKLKGHIRDIDKYELFLSFNIFGTDEFRQKVKKALKLLEKNRWFKIINSYLNCIAEGMRSGVCCDSKSFLIGKKTLGNNTRSATLWLAGCIAHESLHSMLYHENKRPAGTVNSMEEEAMCCQFQLEVTRELSSRSRHIGRLNNYIKNGPDHLGDPNSWLDYYQRNW